MTDFIKRIFSDESGPSSKRVVLFILLAAFLIEIFVNVFTSKQPISELREELFYALSGALGTVFGSNILDAWKEVKTIQSSNNAKVGASSPTQAAPDTTTTIVK